MESRSGSTTGIESQPLELFQAVDLLLNECRMVLPGIQGLFGFQLIVVFSAAFHQQLSPVERGLHLVALALTAVAIALIMTPAAVHRQTHPCEATLAFVRLSTRLLLWSMVPLLLGVCLDFYLVARVISSSVLAAWLAAALGAVFVALWWGLPRVHARAHRRE